MPWPLIAAGVASYIGGTLKNRTQQTTTPLYGAEYSPLLQTMRQLALSRLKQPTDLSPYRASGMENINRAFGNARMASSNDLTARGLSTSPVAGAVDANNQNMRAGSLAGFENSIPLLARQLQAEDIGLAGDVANYGRGSTTVGESGGGAAGGATQLAQLLGYASARGMFTGGNTGVSGGAGFFTPSPTGSPLLPYGAGPRQAGSWGAPTYQPTGFTGWG